MKKIFLFLAFLTATSFAQSTYSVTTAKTYASAMTDTIYFYAPAAKGGMLVFFRSQPAYTDTTIGTTPPTHVFTGSTIDLSTRQIAGAQANSDSTWIRVKPIDRNGNIVHNDSLNVSGTAATTDIYIGSRAYGATLNFSKMEAPFGIALIHQIGGVVAAAVRFEYTVTFLAIQ